MKYVYFLNNSLNNIYNDVNDDYLCVRQKPFYDNNNLFIFLFRGFIYL